MEEQLKRTNLSYEFFDCVVGTQLSDAELNTYCNMDAINALNKKVEWFTRGVIGCTITNQNFFKDIIKRKLEYVLFLEDDAVLPDNLSELLKNVEPHIKQGDLILLFWKAWQPLKLSKPIFETKDGAKFYIPQNPEVVTGGSAYIMTKKAAEKLLVFNTPIHTSPDNWFYFLKNECIDRIICAYPQIVDTADFRSTMQAGSFLFVRSLIDKYKIFPVYQILKYKRNRQKLKTHQATFV